MIDVIIYTFCIQLVRLSYTALTICINEKIRVAYGHPPSCSCGGLGDPSGPQTCMDPTEGAFGPLSHFPIGLLGESYKVR